jgi:hypothetical protein
MRSYSQSATSAVNIWASGMRRSKHWLNINADSIAVISNRDPCLRNRNPCLVHQTGSPGDGVSSDSVSMVAR